MAGWSTLARERADLLADELRDLRAEDIDVGQLPRKIRDVRRNHIEAPHGIADWLTGNSVNESWSELHRIEESIDSLEPLLAVVVSRADTEVAAELPAKRAQALRATFHDSKLQPLERRLNALEAIREAHHAAEARHDSERNQREGMMLIGAGLLLGAVTLLVLQATALRNEVLLPKPSEGTSLSAWGLMALVMLLGALGGGVSSLISLYVAARKFPDTMWFDPRPALTFVKVVLGIWLAVIGVLAVGSGVVVGVYVSVGSTMLLSFMFGYGQQAVTKFLDQRVIAMLQT